MASSSNMTAVPVVSSEVNGEESTAVVNNTTGGSEPLLTGVGVKFRPSDSVLARDYLSKKVSGCTDGEIFQLIKEVDIYQYEPSRLKSFAHDFGDRNMYFFTTLQMEERNGTKFNRFAPGGCWEETENSSYIKDENGKVFAAKATLAYYMNDKKSGQPVKTQWLMKEYMLLEKQSDEEFRMLAPLTLCVVCFLDNNKRSYCEDKSNQSSIPDYCEHNLVMSSAENPDFPRKRHRPCSDLHGSGLAFNIPSANSDQNTEMGSRGDSTDSDVHIPNHFLDPSMNPDDEEPICSLAQLFTNDY